MIDTLQYHALKQELATKVHLVAVSKTQSLDDIMTLYQLGQRSFGENKVQELVEKYENLPKDIQWHMIGHLQTNKVKYIAPFISLIHSVDSEKLLSTIDAEAQKYDRVIPCLLQIKIAQEDTKYGLEFQLAEKILGQQDQYPHCKIIGLMGMASLDDGSQQISKEFQQLHQFYIAQKHQNFHLEVLSMGMSHDYPLAIAQGANMVRVGSLLFGDRH